MVRHAATDSRIAVNVVDAITRWIDKQTDDLDDDKFDEILDLVDHVELTPLAQYDTDDVVDADIAAVVETIEDPDRAAYADWLLRTAIYRTDVGKAPTPAKKSTRPAVAEDPPVEVDEDEAESVEVDEDDDEAVEVDEIEDEAEAEAVEDDEIEDDDSSSVKVGSIDDIPEVCRELMADFLREIEPVVSEVDWDNASMADFEAVSLEFEPIADEFDAATEAEAECNDIELEDDENFALLVDFAKDEAPGSVGFLTFLNELMTSFDEAMEPTTGDGSLATCQDAMDFVQELADEHDSINTVPIDQLTQMTELTTAMFTCSQEELEFFNNPEIAEFLAGA